MTQPGRFESGAKKRLLFPHCWLRQFPRLSESRRSRPRADQIAQAKDFLPAGDAQPKASPQLENVSTSNQMRIEGPPTCCLSTD